MRNAPRIAFKTLGCKLNQMESDGLATRFQEAGYRIVDFDDAAEVYVVNSCTVTSQADRKSRNLLYRAMRNGAAAAPDRAAAPSGAEAPAQGEAPVVVVTGCYADAAEKTLRDIGPTFVVGNDGKSRIFDLVEAYRAGEILDDRSLPRPDRFAYRTPDRLYHTRGMLKVQDGCDNFCSFCIIPFVRGRATSRPLREVLDEARSLIDRGYGEIVLTGVNMSRYNDQDTGFADLVEAVADLPGAFRVRISSLEPDRLDDHFLDVLGHPKMCPHLHLCLQSGSERILLAMRRQYTFAAYRSLAGRIRLRYPGFNLTTDVIVGFPGEGEREFAQTCAAVRDLGFGHVHTFKYSRRSGTRAERMPGQVAEAVKSQRSEIIRGLASEAKLAYRRTLVGASQRLLVEGPGRGAAGVGMGEHYVPISTDRDDDLEQNRFYDVRIEGLDEGEEACLVAKVAAPCSSTS